MPGLTEAIVKETLGRALEELSAWTRRRREDKKADRENLRADLNVLSISVATLDGLSFELVEGFRSREVVMDAAKLSAHMGATRLYFSQNEVRPQLQDALARIDSLRASGRRRSRALRQIEDLDNDLSGLAKDGQAYMDELGRSQRTGVMVDGLVNCLSLGERHLAEGGQSEAIVEAAGKAAEDYDRSRSDAIRERAARLMERLDRRT